MTNLELTKERLATITESESLEELSLLDWESSFVRELASHGYLPDGIVTSDPRTADRIVFNAARAKRPHDHRSSPGKPAAECIVCTGQLTKVLDVATLSQGFTFINKNLYPVVFPRGLDQSPSEPGAEGWGVSGTSSYGLHLLQWTSSYHALDWHNMGRGDRGLVLDRLAMLEQKLLTESVGRYPSAEGWGGEGGHAGFVQIIKNSGAPVGGSVAHGHQQIILTNVMPRKSLDDWNFERRHGHRFSDHLRETTAADLLVRAYPTGGLVVPYFMRRPYDMMYWVRDSTKRYLHQLDPVERADLAEGLHDGIRLMRGALAAMNRHVAYNVVFHVGPGAGIYVEFLPYTQEVGGYEQSGFWSCQASPRSTATHLRSLLKEDGPGGDGLARS